jgi:hypothetical protein
MTRFLISALPAEHLGWARLGEYPALNPVLALKAAQSDTGLSLDMLRIDGICYSAKSQEEFEVATVIDEGIRTMRQPLSIAYNLVKLGYFHDLGDAVEVVASHYAPSR